MQSDKSVFSWYTGMTSSDSQPSVMAQPNVVSNQQSLLGSQPSVTSQPTEFYTENTRHPESLPDSYGSNFNRNGSFNNTERFENLSIPQGSGNGNINIQANNVFIENSPDHGEGSIPINTSTHQIPTSNSSITEVDKHVPKQPEHVTGAAANSSSDSNPLGIPSAHTNSSSSTNDVAPHPPSQTNIATSTAMNDPHVSSTPSAPVINKTTNDGIHNTPLSSGMASDMRDTQQPLSTDHSAHDTMPHRGNTSAAPAPLSHNNQPVPENVQFSKDVHATPESSANAKETLPEHHAKEKKHHEHKSMKVRYQEWKARRHGASGGVSGDVHPKDSRDGRTLPSQNELATRVTSSEPEHVDKSNPTLKKDPHDATGKSITGTDANPSKASMPFKVPEPGHQGAPVEAKVH